MSTISHYLHSIGSYGLFVKRVFSKPEKWSMYKRQFFVEADSLAIGSLGIVSFISLFMGAVITLQSAFGFESPWIPLYAVGVASRDTIILELSPTIISLILTGKVGSSIASELGTMRVTEQLDALEIMGVNSAAYMTLPKILACCLIFPFIIMISMFLAILGGWIFGVLSGAVSSYEYIFGITHDFRVFNVYYSLIKSFVFAFLISSVAAYHGYYTSGGAIEVARSSTRAVVYTSVLILVFNYILTQLLLV
jgi:phospholipid/cholesterol/gamma-HCH transport system permease protein